MKISCKRFGNIVKPLTVIPLKHMKSLISGVSQVFYPCEKLQNAVFAVDRARFRYPL